VVIRIANHPAPVAAPMKSLDALFVNDPNGTDEDCEARSVIANLSFTDENGGQALEVDGGRWADAD